MKVAAAFRDGPAARAGLSAGDAIVAIGGLKATPERLATTLARAAPGNALEVHAFRRDELMSFAVVLAPAPEDTCFLLLEATVAPDLQARRDAWLRG